MSSRVPPAADLAQDPTWFPAIDYIKALAIIAVVFTHAGALPWRPDHTWTDRMLTQGWVDFHVPSFILVAGFLAARSGRMDTRALGRRLVRILCPYLVASFVVQAAGVSVADGPAEILYELATGGSLRIYYFVFLMFVFTLISWPMSRASRGTLEVVLVVVYAYATLAVMFPQLAITGASYWVIRNPAYTYPYFLIGWISFLNLQEIGEIHRSHRSTVRAGAVVTIVGYVAVTATRAFYRLNLVFRSVYTLGVVALITSLTASSTPPTIVRFLSRSAYSVYLYHYLFQIWARPHLVGWSPLSRILASFAAGLAGGLIVYAVGTRLLGRRARLFLG